MITEVTYKKGNKVRYALWGLGVVLIALLGVTFFNMINTNVSATVPRDYKFAIVDNYADGSGIRTTYYVYDDNKILVEDENKHGANGVDRVVMVYDGISTTDLHLDKDDQMEVCEISSCKSQPKVLTTIKALLSRKIGREYLGL